MPLPDANPFATRFTRPGAIPFVFAGEQDAAHLALRLADLGWWGQIVGPHGTGKSTLLHALRPTLEAMRRDIVWFTQSQNERRLATTASQALAWSDNTLVIVDGYEQLGWLARRWLKNQCRRQQAGLLVTSHTDVGLPLLWSTTFDEPLTQRLVRHLLSSEQRALISEADVSRCYQKHAGNVRETLFELYDLYEQKRR